MISFYCGAGIAPGKNVSAAISADERVAYIGDKMGIDGQIAAPVGGKSVPRY